MADDNQNNGGVNGDGAGADQKIVIGDVEMTPDEAKELITKGKSFKELSEKYPDIDFSELPKSFTQTRQELADLKKPKKEEKVDDDETARRQKIRDFFSDPIVREELKNLTDQESKVLREDLEFKEVVKSLEAEYDGSDGRPKFILKDVLEHGQKEQIFNPLRAYKDLHEDALDEWKLKQTLEKKRPSTFSERRGGTGGKQPDVKTPKNFKEATEAALAELE